MIKNTKRGISSDEVFMLNQFPQTVGLLLAMGINPQRLNSPPNQDEKKGLDIRHPYDGPMGIFEDFEGHEEKSSVPNTKDKNIWGPMDCEE